MLLLQYYLSKNFSALTFYEMAQSILPGVNNEAKY